jgi:hypothetical protein
LFKFDRRKVISQFAIFTMPIQKPSKSKVSAKDFIADLVALQGSGRDNSKYYIGDSKTNKFLNVRMASIFKTAKAYGEMSMDDIEKLLSNDFYEVRMGAVSIMDFQARDKSVSEAKKKQLYDLYMLRLKHMIIGIS